MASLLTSAQKTQYNDVMDDHHDTFARAVTVYKDAVVTVPTPNISYNSMYGNAAASQPKVFTSQSSTIHARIMYGKEYNEQYISDDKLESQNKIKIPEGQVRLKFKAEDYATMSEAKRVEFDSQKFAIDSDLRANGLFDVKFYTVFVRPVD